MKKIAFAVYFNNMDKTTIDAYDQLAKEYDEETSGFWASFPVAFIDAFVKAAQGRVLDIGSGPGRDALLLKAAGFEVVCVDASKEMVTLSSARGLESVVGDFNTLPFKDASFDGAWAYTSLLHVPKSEVHQSLSEVRRVLKEGGTFALGLIEGNEEFYRETSDMHAPRWFSFYRKTEIEELLREHGFDIMFFYRFQPKSKKYLNFIAKKVEIR